MAPLLLGSPRDSRPAERTSPESRDLGPADRLGLERGLALMLIVAAAICLRARDPLYSTAYMDESIYVVYGRMFMARHFEAPLATPLQWSFGWYLWPVMAAVADRIGGLLALRELAAGLGTLTVIATYGFAGRVFSKTVGLGAAAVMALMAPAVLVSRIATRDSGSICFFALGLWAFAVAWQENKKRQWALAGVLFFAAFLCKYLVAIYFPALVLLALWKGKKPLLLFASPLFAACAVYAALTWHDLLHLLRYGSGYGSLQADLLSTYVLARWDLLLLALPGAAVFAHRPWRARAIWMWIGALIVLAFQWQIRADYDSWKHANYTLLFLVPAAVAGMFFVVERLARENYLSQALWGTAAMVGLAVGAGALGKVHDFHELLFWPNVNPALAYFEGRLAAYDQVLADDTVFRYYFAPPLPQSQISDPMYFQFAEPSGKVLSGDAAYEAAVRSGAFTYIVLDGGMGKEAARMDAAIRPVLDRYRLEMNALDPVLGHNIEIYSRVEPTYTAGVQTAAPGPKAASDGETSSSQAMQAAGVPGIRILSPASRTTVDSEATMVTGVATGAQAGWYARIEVFTDRWHPQGEAVPIAADGSFHQSVFFSGAGKQRCFHLLRARLMDSAGDSRAVALNYGIARAGNAGNCPALPSGR